MLRTSDRKLGNELWVVIICSFPELIFYSFQETVVSAGDIYMSGRPQRQAQRVYIHNICVLDI